MTLSPLRILLVEDAPTLVRVLLPALQAAGYEGLSALTGAEAIQLMAIAAPALVLLDLGLPDIDGKEMIPRLRALSEVPVIVLSGRAEVDEKVAALDAGADDYIEKPVAVTELLARIRAALRRVARLEQMPLSTSIQVGPIGIDRSRRLVEIAGQPLRLTPREWELLVTLGVSAGRVLTQRQLLIALWGPGHAADAQYLRVLVGRIRAKLGPAAELLHTIPGVGYRLGEV